MPQVHHVLKARKNNKDAGIKKGDSYYWWKFKFGGKIYSKTSPKQSQLTQSDFLSQIYGIQERFDRSFDLEELRSERDSAVDEIRSLADECEEKRSNMPEQLQDSGSGETLQNRVDSCNEYADELEGIDLDFEKEEDESEEDFETRVEDANNEVQGVSYNGE